MKSPVQTMIDTAMGLNAKAGRIASGKIAAIFELSSAVVTSAAAITEQLDQIAAAVDRNTAEMARWQQWYQDTFSPASVAGPDITDEDLVQRARGSEET